MLSFKQFLNSKTVWALVATFIFNGLQATHPIVDSDTANKVNLMLAGVTAAARVANTQNK